ncbi:MAG: DUF1080 domain-containing protein [Verrucomicrobiota bacterium]|nr:DUF1080 domain-containing protein [Verrucomicrobiota bacterium]
MLRTALFGSAREILRWVAPLMAASQCALGAGLVWPADRLLPAFPAPAATIDCIDLSHASGAEADLFASLEGIVNRAQPRIVCVSGQVTEGKFTWLKLHHLRYQMIGGYDALLKYKTNFTGLVVTDPRQPDTLNLATTLAGLNDALICAPSLLPMLTNAPYKFAVETDLRGHFLGEHQVYQYLYVHCWPRCSHRVIAGMAPHLHGNLRDYLVAVKAAVVWLNPQLTNDASALAPFLSDMTPADGVFMGWWPDEESGLKWVGRYGIPVLASDFFDNASLFGGITSPVHAPPLPPSPPLQNKIYVSIFLSDGDNVQYMQHRLKHNWDDPARGSVPIGWTVSPLAADLDPAMLDYYWSTATTNDCLVSGPSGAGYARLDFWNAAHLNAYTKMTESYLRRSGLRVITVWLHANDAIGEAFAANCPTLLGVASQEGDSFATLHGRLPVIGMPADANYAGSISQIEQALAKIAKAWDGLKPRFIAVQGNGWDLSPADCRTLAGSLDTNKFVVVRPDDLFRLCRESLGHDPPATNASGWRDILPPANLAGWTRVPIPATHKLGRAQWHLDRTGKILVCDGDGGHEMLRYDKELGDCIFHVECRFVPAPGAQGKYNSGVFIRTSADGAVWYQAQVASVGGFLFGDTPVGGKRERFQTTSKENRMKPAGEWNSLEVTARGKKLTVWLNGAVTAEFGQCGVSKGYIALEAEGHRIEFRNLRLKEIPAD